MSSQTNSTANLFASKNALGGPSDNDETRKRRFEDLPKQNRFFEMKHQRDALRLKYIEQGILPDPDKAQDLSAAKSLLGICMEMCSDYEREEREFQNEGDGLEMFPGTSRIDPALAVKIYRRPAAGRELPLPEDVRPPIVLRKTLDYLFEQLLPSDPASPQFTTVQPFMWNRTRAIRQDFIVQGLRGPLEIECHERIARYHILCLHWKGGVGAEGWSEQQELEQLRKTIRSLTEFYEDLRRSDGNNSPNEAEFRAYNLLLHMQDPETLREVEALPADVFDSPDIQAALRLRSYAQRSNNVIKRGRPLNTEATMNLWTRYFGEIKRNSNVSYLLACLAENAFSQVRAGAIKAMGKAYLPQHAPLPLEYLRRTLGMDNTEEARSFGLALNCEEVASGEPGSAIDAMRLQKANEEKPLPTTPFSSTIVEVKRKQQTSQAIVNGLLSGAVPLLAVEGGPAVSACLIPKVALSSRKGKVHTPAVQSTALASLPTQSPFIATTQSPVLEPKASVLPTRPTASTRSETLGASLSASAPVFTPKAISFSTKEDSAAPSVPGSTPFIPSSHFSFAQKPPFQASRTSSTALGTTLTSGISAFQASPLFPSSASVPTEDGNKGAAHDEVEGNKAPVAASSSLQERIADPHPEATVRPPAFVIGDELPKFSSPHETEKPKRTIESVASSLYDALLVDLLHHKVSTIGEQACLRQLRIRRKEARESVVDDTTNRLLKHIQDDVVEEVVAKLSSEAIADEFRTRSLEKMTLRGRRRAVRQAMERKRQTERLNEIRLKLRGRGINFPASDDGVSHRDGQLALDAMEDEDLQRALLQAREDRQTLWTSKIFVKIIEKRLRDVALPSVHLWAAGVSFFQRTSSTSNWLRTKFSLTESVSFEENYREGGCVRVLDLDGMSSEDMEEEKDVGMVIVELDPSLTGTRDNEELWTAQRHKVEALSQHSIVKKSRFHPHLLLIAWSSGEELLRKTIVQKLHLGATSAHRYSWSKVEICCINDSIASPQERFQESIEQILQRIDWNPDKIRLDFDTVSTICRASWERLLQRVNVAYSQLNESHRGGVEKREIAIRVFNIVTILANQSIDDLFRISTTLLEDAEEKEGLARIAMPLAMWSEKQKMQLAAPSKDDNDINQLLLDLALVQLKNCYERTNNETFTFLQTWLLEQYDVMQEMARFPWLAYFERVYQWCIEYIQDNWLECNLLSREAVQAQVVQTSRLCQSAWTEIEWKIRESLDTILTASHTPSASPLKRRVSSKDSPENSSVKRSNYKTRKLETNPAAFKQAPILSSKITTLRALMASAADLLEGDTH
ncbi:hypothetical protein CBS101457_004132 [Exobasidium rhododendri]|nr:hypothetical protein CBS101457_004132 [Exobasidium rhododendri]